MVSFKLANQPSSPVRSPQSGMSDPKIRKLLSSGLKPDTDINSDFRLLVDVDYVTIAQEVHSLGSSMADVASNGMLPDNDVIKAITSVNPGVTNSLGIRSMWKRLAQADGVIETKPAAARVLMALSLKAHSDIWNWFHEHVTQPVFNCDNHLDCISWREDIRGVEMPNSWIAPLYTDVRSQQEKQRLVGGNVDLNAVDYFKDLGDEKYVSSSRMSTLYHVEHALFGWLDFRSRPGMILETSRAVASFITTASEALGNTDFLYLHCIQSRIKSIRANLTAEREYLPKIQWEGLYRALEDHPLANQDSSEAVGLARLKELLWVASGLPRFDPILRDKVELIKEYKEAAENPGVEPPSGIRAFLNEMWVLIQPLLQPHLIPSQVARAKAAHTGASPKCSNFMPNLPCHKPTTRQPVSKPTTCQPVSKPTTHQLVSKPTTTCPPFSKPATHSSFSKSIS